MTFRTHTHDLTERVSEIDNRLEQINQREEEIKARIEEDIESGEYESVSDAPQHLHDEWEDLELEKTEISGERRKFMDAVVHWMTDLDVTTNPSFEEVEEAYTDVDECVFVTEELSYGQVQSVQDDMMEKSFELDIQEEDMDGTPKQGYMQIELLREAIVDWPEEAPTRTRRRTEEPEPGDYPEQVSDWLFDRVDAYNTTQESELGNTSLEEEMS
jgi:Arc/MetJ-type ribon-helix-helix transcriptional regulator